MLGGRCGEVGVVRWVWGGGCRCGEVGVGVVRGVWYGGCREVCGEVIVGVWGCGEVDVSVGRWVGVGRWCEWVWGVRCGCGELGVGVMWEGVGDGFRLWSM